MTRAVVWCIAVCLVASMFLSQALGGVQRIEKRRRYCGRQLVDVLSFLCTEYYDPDQKRHTYDTPAHDLSLQVWFPFLETSSSDDKVPNGFLESKSALQFLRSGTPYSRHTRGIIEECCHKSCSTNELMSYCSVVRNDYVDGPQ